MALPAPAPAPTDPPPPAAAPLWQQRWHTRDPDAHARAQRDWALHDEQLSEGRFEGLVHHVQLPMARLVHEHCNVAAWQRGRFVDGTCGLVVPAAGAVPA